MPSDKAAYLAAHYLSAGTKPSSSSSSTTKKRKRKQPASSGLLITDDDETGWGGSNPNPDDDDDAPLTLAGTTTADFRRAKKSAWKTLGGGSTPAPKPTTADAAASAAEADAILAQAATDTLALTTPQDDDPPPATVQVMSNGAHAGLQTASALTAQIRARQQQEAAELAALQQNPNSLLEAQYQQTVTHRDAATGRRLSTSHLLASARQAVADEALAKKTAQSLLRGEVQQAQAAARREALQDAALMPLARGRDDEEMNREMREQERWNDPMAEFMAPKQQQGKSGGGKGGRGRPVYKGGAAPNRYGIRPGYRWDGVDRGNGFEGERFRALNRREMGKGLEYAWQMDE